MLTRQLIENQIQYTNREMEKNPVDSYGELYRLWRLWGEELRGTSMCARHSSPTITVGVGDFAGQSWASPGHVVIVDRLVQDGMGGRTHGRGVCLKDLGSPLHFYTELDELLLDGDVASPGFIAEQVWAWMVQQMGGELPGPKTTG